VSFRRYRVECFLCNKRNTPTIRRIYEHAAWWSDPRIYARDGSPLFRRRHVVIRFLATCPVRPSVRTSPQYRSVIRRTAARVRRSAADDDERGDNAVVVVVINRPQANAPTTEIRKMAATDVYK